MRAQINRYMLFQWLVFLDYLSHGRCSIFALENSNVTPLCLHLCLPSRLNEEKTRLRKKYDEVQHDIETKVRIVMVK
jgi:hypothetical protein